VQDEVVRSRSEMTFEEVVTPKKLKQTDNKFSESIAIVDS
jgi:hypothetical protein